RSVKLPESGGAFVDGDMSLEACKEKCLENCSCTAYCNMEISNGGRGCVTWFGELMDMRISMFWAGARRARLGLGALGGLGGRARRALRLGKKKRHFGISKFCLLLYCAGAKDWKRQEKR
ncbi:unnamed protein product, partial [Prunus brigantina]